MGIYHAVKSPSSSKRWGGREACTASIKAQRDYPSGGGNDASRRGTCGHQMSEEMLLDESIDPQSYLGRTMVFNGNALPFWDDTQKPVDEAVTEELEPEVSRAVVIVDQALIDECMTHVLYVRERVALTGGTLYVEQSVPIDHITGETDATGSADVGIVYGNTVEIVDAKFGRTPVDAYEVVTPAHGDFITGKPVPEVVEPNEQIAMYASGFMRKLELLYDFKDVILTISQPPLGRVSQWSGTVDEMNVVIDRLRQRSVECDENPVFRPSASNCHFCRASGNCAAQTEMVVTAALDGFGDAETTVRTPADIDLGEAYRLVPLVSTWLKAVGERMYAALSSGQRIARADGLAYKLVAGKKGARAWTDAAEAEATLKKMRLKREQMYTESLISPTMAEKLAKVPKAKKGETPPPAALGPTQWNKLQTLITQDEGKPSIVLETDPRPPVATALDGFGDVPPADNSDLFEN
jgi:hypothetical protein